VAGIGAVAGVTVAPVETADFSAIGCYLLWEAVEGKRDLNHLSSFQLVAS
jgi:hypothetical protein